jgi:ABC-type Na+ efflux pump permease subunit
MSKVYTIAKYEFLSTIRKKVFLFMALLLPLLVAGPIFLAIYMPSGIGTNANVGFVDDTGLLEPSGKFVKYASLDDAKKLS